MQTIFSSPSFREIAARVAQESQEKQGNIRSCPFADNWPDSFIENVAEDVEWKTIWYIGDISNKEEFFERLSEIYALPRYGADKVHVVIPYFPTGTMERVEKEGQIATAKTLARALSATPAGERGMTTFHIFDIHALQERFYFGDNISVRLHSALWLVKKKVEWVLDLSVAFPDEGAQKRFGRDFPGTPEIICTKIRQGDKRIITVKEGEVEGRNILIVDDLIQTGGTIRESARKLRDMGAKSVSAYATHGVFPNNSHERLVECLDHLYVTDSIPDNKERFKGNSRAEVLSIAPLVSELVGRTMRNNERKI